jgi:tRNA pseudouridine38-40 synthase
VPTYRLVVEYAGEAFAGWQVQAGGEATVQGALAEAVRRVTGETVLVTGSGRTDAGVHAEAQVASLVLERGWPADRLQRAMNGVLPRAVAVRSAALAPDGFDALRDATGKRYRYRIWNGAVRSPLRAVRFAHVPRPLDLAAMREAAARLAGEHDFRSFQAAGSDVLTTVRRLWRLDVEGEPGGEVHLVAEGSGFLRHMVRNLAGTLIEVGLGRRAPGSMEALLAARDRREAGPTAPAEGLTLEHVHYGEVDGEVDRAGAGAASGDIPV